MSPTQRVDLVDHEHQRSGVRLGPACKGFSQRVVGSGAIENAGPDLRDEQIVQRVACSTTQRAENRPHGRAHVFSCRLSDFDVDVRTAELAAGIEVVFQREERGGLAGLARRMQDEVLFLPDE